MYSTVIVSHCPCTAFHRTLVQLTERNSRLANKDLFQSNKQIDEVVTIFSYIFCFLKNPKAIWDTISLFLPLHAPCALYFPTKKSLASLLNCAARHVAWHDTRHVGLKNFCLSSTNQRVIGSILDGSQTSSRRLFCFIFILGIIVYCLSPKILCFIRLFYKNAI